MNQSTDPTNRNQRILLLVMLVLLAALVLVACGSDTAPEGSPDENAPVAILPTPAPGTPSVEAKYNTWVRGGPSADYPVYGSFLGGATAQAIGKSQDNAWWVISVPVAATGQGWVPADAVNASSADGVPVVVTPPLPPDVDLLDPGPDDPQVTANVEVYVRSGPGLQYPAYGIAQPGDTGGVIGISEDGSYWVVRLNPEVVGAGHAWVDVNYVTAKNTENVPVIQTPPTGTAAPIPPPAPDLPSDAATVTALDYLNVRTGPGTNYPVIGVVAPGTTGHAIGKSHDSRWYSVNIDANESPTGQAWVSADWVYANNTGNLPIVEAPPAPPVPEIPTPAPGAPTVTAREPINVRTGPGTAYPSYGVASVGAKGEAIGISEDGGWYVVKLPTTVAPDGRGWVSAAYVLAENTGGLPIIETPPVP